ncbi:MAG TPA: LysR family transcriptional regulator [Chloroflexota bacterium]|nr:LysR family transcriptional regulator [Chloroflexota bacterium]
MNGRLLRLYCEVVECRSVTLAAEHLMISQPAVSMNLRRIERHFGADLFYRNGRQMLATEAGLAVYRYAKSVLEGEGEVSATIRELGAGAAGRVVLGASNMIGSYYLPPLLSRFKLERPDAEISVQVLPKEQICAGVVGGELDFAIVTRDGVPDNLVCQEFHRERLLVVAGQGHPLARLRRVGRDDLLRYPLVAFSRDVALNQRIFDRLREAGLSGPIRIAIHLGHAEAIKRVVEAGVGIAVLFECAVRRELDLGILKDVTPADIELWYQPFAAIYRPKKRFSALQAALLDFLITSAL